MTLKTNTYPLVIDSNAAKIFPGSTEPLEFLNPDVTEMVELAIANFDGHLIITADKTAFVAKDDTTKKYGFLVKATIIKKWNDGSLTISAEDIKKVSLDAVETINGVNYATVSELLEKELTAEELTEFSAAAAKIIDLLGDLAEPLKERLSSPTAEDSKSLGSYIDDILKQLDGIDKTSQATILQEQDPLTKINMLLKALSTSLDTNSIDDNINKKIKNRIDEQQKEYYLREKLRAIKEELNDGEVSDNSIDSYRKRLAEEPFPNHIKERILSEIEKLDGIPASSTEGNIQRTYIDWMMQLPWWQKTEDKKDLKFAQEVLDSHHYGLKKVKERIIEYLAVKQKTDSVRGQIIVLVGPPGVGKTSLAKSIAEALGRNFVKVSLGGVKDEAEIRGHRKTYIAAMPGRIIQSMKRAKSRNPLFLLDEIDKMASDYKGDPSSAMLEVLDPEQNREFSDNYIEEPFDLGDVMFIATANYPQDIPEALYDRMEIIELSSYTEIEKIQIARQYLVAKVLEEMNTTNEELQFTDDAISEIIKYYTREAGVRQLERLLATVVRKFIVKQLNGEIKTQNITPEVVREYLGKHIFEHTSKQEKSNVGVVTGLAYTQFGGDILPIEVNYFPGKGNLILTGKLGEVMKESATIAFDYVKSNYAKFGIDKAVFETNDVHIHVPEGATPKDGPSAGITLTTALISALTGRPVSESVGMTGEITLQGHVLPIGGLREKSISAARSQLKKILIPQENIKDLDEIPDEVKSVLEIKPVKEYQEVFDEIFNLTEEK